MKRFSLGIVLLLAACSSGQTNQPYHDDRIDPSAIERSIGSSTAEPIQSSIPDIVEQDAPAPQ